MTRNKQIENQVAKVMICGPKSVAGVVRALIEMAEWADKNPNRDHIHTDENVECGRLLGRAEMKLTLAIRALDEIYHIGYNQSSGYSDAKAIQFAQKLAGEALEKLRDK